MSPRTAARGLGLVLGLLLPAAGHAAEGNSALAVTRMPLSARQQASGGTWGNYDVLGVVENPALLAAQPGKVEVTAADHYLFSSSENVLGLGAGWVTGSADAGLWGAALVAAQASTRAFDEVDGLGNATGGRVAPVARRIDVAGAYRRGGIAVGAAVGTAAESYGDLADGAGTGPHAMQATAGCLAMFDGWNAGAALAFRGLGGGTEGGAPDAVNAGGSVDLAGLRLAGSVSVPLGGPAGPDALAGIRWPVSDAFDLQAAYNASFAPGVAGSNGGSVRLGFSLRSTGLGMDYAMVVPLSSGLGMTHLIALGWSLARRRAAATAPY